MKKDILFKNLIKVLNDRIPQRGRLAEFLTELLGIEKEAVYRRLRGSVPFSFQEVYTIALNFGFSLDSIAEDISPHSRQMTVLLIDFLEPQESDYERLENLNLLIHRLNEDSASELGAIGSIIPDSLRFTYDYIYKFGLFKLSHQFGDLQKLKTYAETNPPERIKLINRDFVKSIQNAPKSIYIFDRRFIEYFANDICFYYDIRLITEEDVLRLKEDLNLLLNDLERYSDNGCFDTGKKVEFFLANIHFNSNYKYVDSTTYKVTMMNSFAFNDAYSFDEVAFRSMKNWFNFLKRTSTLISGGNVKERILFFEQQRKIVDSL